MIVCLVIVAAIVGWGLYTQTGRGVVDQVFLPKVQQITNFEDEGVTASGPSEYILEVTDIVSREYGHTAFLTRTDNGRQYEMLLNPPDPAYVPLEVGSIILAEVDSVLEREPPAPALLYPTTVKVIE